MVFTWRFPVRGKIQRLSTGLGLLIFFGPIPTGPNARSPHPYRDPQVYSQIITIRDTILAGDYSSARRLCDRLEETHPNLLAPSLGRLLSLHAQMFEQDHFALEPVAQVEFNHLLARFQALGQKRPLVFEDFLFLGGAYGSRALMLSLQENYWEAFRLGLLGLYYVSRGHGLEPNLLDDQLAWGIFHYYRGYLAQSLSWLPLYADDMAKGLDELHRARSGLYTSPVATLALVFVLGRGAQPEKSLPYAEQLRARFPDSPLLAIEYGRALLHHGRYPEAAALFSELRGRVPQNNKLLYYLGWAHTYWAQMTPVENPAEHRESAEKFLQDFLAGRPDPIYASYAQLLLGDLDRQSGRLEPARAHYRAALELNPGYSAGRERLQEVSSD